MDSAVSHGRSNRRGDSLQVTAAATSISVEQAVGLIGRDPGLVVGPAATAYPSVLADIRRAIIARFPGLALPSSGDYFFDLVDVVEELHREHLIAVRQAIRDELDRLKPSANVAILADQSWSAVVSLTPDSLLDSAIRDRFDRLATTRTVTSVTSPKVSLPPRTLPIYRLLGTPTASDDESRLCFSEADLAYRTSGWQGLLSSLADVLKVSPLFFLGTESVPQITANFFGRRIRRPSSTSEAVVLSAWRQNTDNTSC